MKPGSFSMEERAKEDLSGAPANFEREFTKERLNLSSHNLTRTSPKKAKRDGKFLDIAWGCLHPQVKMGELYSRQWASLW